MRAHDSLTEHVEGTDNCNLGPLMFFSSSNQLFN